MPGGSPTSRRGDGYEFVELRSYVPGDDVRRIDWAATARSGELQTRVVLEDVGLMLAGILDDSPSMRIGRRRPLLEAAREALQLWYEIAEPEDRCLRVIGKAMYPAGALRGAASAAAALRAGGAFDVLRSLETARAALRAGTALLAIGDWFDFGSSGDELLHALARRYDCTMLFARDPWFDGLALSGIVRIRGAEGGALRAYVGARERQCYAQAVRRRENEMLARFATAGWRTGVLHESGGAASLAAAFGLRVARAG